MRRSVVQLAAGIALVGLGVGGGWAAAAASDPSASAASPITVDAGTGAGQASGAGFTGALVAYDSCSSLLDALHARGRSVVGPYGWSNGGVIFPGGLEKSSAASLAPAAPMASAQGSPSAAGAAPLAHSTTNTQVAGVDEPDMVKTDGRYLVSLDGQLLHIVDVRTAKLRATLALPYPGSELLLAGDRVVVLSGESSGPLTYPGGLNEPYAGGALYGGYAGYGSNGTTVATVVDITNPDAPSVVRSWTFNASELAARVVNGTIRLVLTSSPPEEDWASPRDSSAAEKTRATKVNQEIVDATPLSSWLPTWTGDDGQSHQLSTCDAVATPTKPDGLGMVTVLSLDPRSSRPGAGTSVLGDGNVAYAEGEHLFVSDSGTYPVAVSAPNTAISGPMVPTTQAMSPTIHLLEFDLSDPAQARYLASGTLPGQLHDSYALSEYQNHLRVTTTTTNASGVTSTGVSELAEEGDRLVQVGRLGGLGTGEQVYAVRYIGDRGYVVTFQQVDPLHVIDLSNPLKPALRGTLTLTGYSSLLLPLTGHRLLGIGRSVTSGSKLCYEACPQVVEPGGLQLSLFDVSDPAHPKLLDRHVLSDTYADAVSDPHAVTISPSGDLVVLPSTSGPLAVNISATRLTTTTGAFTKPYSVQDERTVIAGERLFEVTDRGVAVRTLPALEQTGWIAF